MFCFVSAVVVIVIIWELDLQLHMQSVIWELDLELHMQSVIWELDLQLHMQSVAITTKIVY
jgi:hypothetical protein